MPEAQKLRYIGPIDELTIPALGVSVKRNHQLAVEDPGIAAALLEQADWEAVGAKTAGKQEDADAAGDAPKRG